MIGHTPDHWLAVARDAARMAGEHLSNPAKDGRAVLTDKQRDVKIAADVSAESIILNYLHEQSAFSILSEEKGFVARNDPMWVWIVDPLDGSFNYMRGIPLCCISIALWKDNEPFLGVIYDFSRQELYSGIVGKGAWCNEHEIRPSDIRQRDKAVLCTGFPVNSDFSSENLNAFIRQIQHYKKIRLLGSASLSLAYVASGRADAYVENDIMIWDVAAGLAIASGSGCSVSMHSGNKPNSLHVEVFSRSFE